MSEKLHVICVLFMLVSCQFDPSGQLNPHDESEF